MSFLDCIFRQTENQVIPKATANAIKREYDAMVEKYTLTMPSAVAAEKVAFGLANNRINSARALRNAKLSQIVTTRNAVQRVDETLRARQSHKSDGNKATQFFVGSPKMADVVVDTVLEPAYRRSETIARELFNGIDEVMAEFGEKWLGLKHDYAGFMDLVVKVIDGDTTDPMVVALRAASDRSTEMFNAAGGHMNKIDNYAPQVHNGAKLEKMGYQAWKDAMDEAIDRSNFIDRDTGMPMDDIRWNEVLEMSFGDIVSDGRTAINRNAERTTQKRDLWNSRQNARQFTFKDSAAWRKYNATFGADEKDMMDVYFKGLHSMASDIGIMQVMGPMPDDMMHQMSVKMSGATGEAKAPNRERLANSAYDVLVGGYDEAANNPAYRAVMAIQNGLRAAMLGSASLTAMSDAWFVKMGLQQYGMKGNKGVKNFVTSAFNNTDRKLVANSAHNLELAMNVGVSSSRLNEGTTLGVGGNKIERGLAWASKSVHTASGLRAVTTATGDAASLELASTFSFHAENKTQWMDIDPEFKKGLEANNFTETDWAVIMDATPLEGAKGTNYITPEQVARINKDGFDYTVADALDTSRKLADFDVMMRYLVTNTPRLRTRAMLTAGAVHGSPVRAIASSVGMFKSFPLEVLQNFLLPSIAKAAKGSFGDLTSLVIGTTAIAGVVLMVNDLLSGREVREMDANFVKDAFLKGGATSFIGDFLLADHNEFGRSYVQDFVGPMGSFLGDTFGLISGTTDILFSDGGPEEAANRLSKSSRDFLKRYTAGQSLWYAKTILQRTLFEGLDRMMSNDFNGEMKTKNDRIQDNYGADMIWSHGEANPFN